MKKSFLVALIIIMINIVFISCSDSSSTYHDLCLPNPCAESLIPNKTVCEDLGGDYTCICEPGYKIKDNLCVKISNNIPCENNPCTQENKTICSVVGDSYECNCDVGFHPDDDNCVEDSGTACEDYNCPDEFSSCQLDENDDAFCECYSGYINTDDTCIFDCSGLIGSHANEENTGCECEIEHHIESNKCIANTKRVSCLINNPDKPVNSQEVTGSVDISWNEELNEWNPTPYCLWTCFEEYKGDYCDECNADYLMDSETDTCLYDCSSDVNSVPNEANDDCECKDSYHIGNNGNCVETINPCEPNHCLDNDGNSGKTNCIVNSYELGDYTCECEDSFEEDNEGICIELQEIHLRAVTGNISTGNYQSYDYGHGIRIFQGLKADVMMVQEFNYKENTEEDYKEMVRAVFQNESCFGSDVPPVDQTCFYEVGTGAVIPNGVISRYPIISWGEWDDPATGVNSTRHLNYAIIDIPGNKDLFVVSVHLHTSPSSDQVASAVVIVNAIKEMKEEADYAGYYFMVGGDFNGPSAASDDGFGMYNTFDTSDSISIENGGTPPLGEDGSPLTSANRSKHLDWLLVSPDLHTLQVPTKFCNNDDSNDCKQYPEGFVMDTRDFSQTELDTYFAPTGFDERVLSVNDSDAGSMQHMAIIKDFLITFE